jgi:hypothetical protein
LVGAAVVIATAAVFLLWSADFHRVRRYLSPWGWLIFAGLTAAWPWLVYRRYPEVWENWRFDYAGGTTQYNEPIWYYPFQLLGGLAPWTPAALLGLWLTWRRAIRIRGSAERFLWCWAIVPIVLLSIPHRKHHHYLVPSLAPWAILAALALRDVVAAMFRGAEWSRRPVFGLLVFGVPGAAALIILRAKIPGPPWAPVLLAIAWLAVIGLFYLGLRRKRPGLVMAAAVAGISIGYFWGQSCLLESDQTVQDTQFLRRVEATVARDAPLFINADLRGELDFFRIGFYLRPEAKLLHNLTFLRDGRIQDREVYVITRAKDRAKLDELGATQVVFQSARTRRESSPADRFTLFRLRFRPDVERYPVPSAAEISPMQAMGRKKGPYCGPPL